LQKKLFYISAFLLFAGTAYSQCAMCKAAAESSIQNDPNAIAKGLNKGILFLMGIPYLVVAIIFRKELSQFVKNLRNKEKTAINKKSLEKLTFAITFITCAVVLFILFISIYKTHP
jgi:amino acid permease